MSNQDLLEQQVSNFKKGKIKNNKGISIVWLLPIVALLIAIWLGYKAYSEKGVNVTISFKGKYEEGERIFSEPTIIIPSVPFPGPAVSCIDEEILVFRSCPSQEVESCKPSTECQ